MTDMVPSFLHAQQNDTPVIKASQRGMEWSLICVAHIRTFLPTLELHRAEQVVKRLQDWSVAAFLPTYSSKAPWRPS